MLTKDEAVNRLLLTLPTGKIQKSIDYKDLYIFVVFFDIPGEEGMDPLFSVNKYTGEVNSFPILIRPDGAVIAKLLMAV